MEREGSIQQDGKVAPRLIQTDQEPPTEMSGVFLCLLQNWEAAARRNFLLDRKDKQAVFSAPPIGEAGSASSQGAVLLLDRKDKQAGPMRLFIVFSPTGKTSKQILQVTAM